MTTTTKLASAALAGLLTAGLLAATPAFAGTHDKASCNAKSGCKGKVKAEKSECKGKAAAEKASCKGKTEAKEASSCTGKDKAAGEKASCKGESK